MPSCFLTSSLQPPANPKAGCPPTHTDQGKHVTPLKKAVLAPRTGAGKHKSRATYPTDKFELTHAPHDAPPSTCYTTHVSQRFGLVVLALHHLGHLVLRQERIEVNARRQQLLVNGRRELDSALRNQQNKKRALFTRGHRERACPTGFVRPETTYYCSKLQHQNTMIHAGVTSPRIQSRPIERTVDAPNLGIFVLAQAD